MAQTTINTSKSTEERIDRLKEKWEVKTMADVIRKALAISELVFENAENGVLTVVGPNNSNTKIVIT